MKELWLRNRSSDNCALIKSGWSQSKGLQVSGSVTLCIIHIGRWVRISLCFITTYTFRLYVENMVNSSRVEGKWEFFSWRFGDTDSFGKAAVQDSQSTEKEMEWRYIWLLCRNYAGWKRVKRIRWNTKEMRMKIITFQYLFFFLSLFLASKQGLDTDIFKAAALFSLWKLRFSNSRTGKAAESLQTDSSCSITWWPSC